jgi:hypothetical protein
MYNGAGVSASCYGSVAVTSDRIIEDYIRYQSNITVPAAELRALRCSLILAKKYKDYFRTINFFSDSQLTIMTLRDYIYKWTYDPEINEYRSRRVGRPVVVNISPILECCDMLIDLQKDKCVNLYHQKGHVSNGKGSIEHATETFKKSNAIKGSVDYNFIRYISIYNNYIDNKTRSYLQMQRKDIIQNYYHDAISYIPNGDLFTKRGE